MWISLTGDGGSIGRSNLLSPLVFCFYVFTLMFVFVCVYVLLFVFVFVFWFYVLCNRGVHSTNLPILMDMVVVFLLRLLFTVVDFPCRFWFIMVLFHLVR